MRQMAGGVFRSLSSVHGFSQATEPSLAPALCVGSGPFSPEAHGRRGRVSDVGADRDDTTALRPHGAGDDRWCTTYGGFSTLCSVKQPSSGSCNPF